MKTIRWIVASMLVGLFVVGCIGSSTDEENVGEAQQALPTNYHELTYYSEPAKIHEVGYCFTPSICTGSYKRCTGTITPWYTDLLTPCDH